MNDHLEIESPFDKLRAGPAGLMLQSELQVQS